jgi:hypothetical protein
MNMVGIGRKMWGVVAGYVRDVVNSEEEMDFAEWFSFRYVICGRSGQEVRVESAAADRMNI